MADAKGPEIKLGLVEENIPGTNASSEDSLNQRPDAHVWLFFANVGDVSQSNFTQTDLGSIVYWRHGTDAFTKNMMQPGDVVAFCTANANATVIEGLGFVAAVRQPFFLDTNRYVDTNAYVQRIPAVVTDLFQGQLIDEAAITQQTGIPMRKGRGSIFRIAPENVAALREAIKEASLPESAFSLTQGQKATRALEQISEDFNREDNSNLLALTAYLSRKKRADLYAKKEPELDTLEHYSGIEIIQAIGEVWDTQQDGHLTDLDVVDDNPIDHTDDDLFNRGEMAQILAARLRKLRRSRLQSEEATKNEKDTAPSPFKTIRKKTAFLFSKGRDYLRNKFSRSTEINQYNISNSAQSEDQAPFTILIDTPWGGGKTSFANFIKSALLNDRQQKGDDTAGKDDDWIVVDFNAWRHQHVRPVWWVLYNYIFKKICNKTKKFLFIKLYTKNIIWKMTNANFIIIAISASSAILITSLFINYFGWIDSNGELIEANSDIATENSENTGTDTNSQAQDVPNQQNDVGLFQDIISFLVSIPIFQYIQSTFHTSLTFAGDVTTKLSGFVFTIMLVSALPITLSIRGAIAGVAKAMSPGRASDQTNYSLGTNDPLERFRKHFRELLAKRNAPVLLIIDDVDRCDCEFVVELIHGLHTLLRSKHLYVLILGDRRWIETCFQNEYSNMEAVTGEPIGRLFVEKALQMSLILPSLSIEDVASFLEQTTSKTAGVKSDDVVDGSHAASGQSDAELNQTLVLQELETERQQLFDEAVALTESEAFDTEIERDILSLAPYFPSNPRRIKLIVNMVSFYQLIGIALAVVDDDRHDIMKFTIWTVAHITHHDLWKEVSLNPSLLENLPNDALTTAGMSRRDQERFLDMLHPTADTGIFGPGGDCQGLIVSPEDVVRFRHVIPVTSTY